MSDIEKKKTFWNIVFSVFFVGIFFILLRVLYVHNGVLPTRVSFFDLSLMVLATFRLTRLFVYDKITFFIRDALYHAKEEYTEEGVTYFLKKERVEGPMLTAYELLTCPWCFSMWAATFVAFFYFFTPLAWLPICIFAISGVASLVQIITNMIGWAAENGKIKATTKSQ